MTGPALLLVLASFSWAQNPPVTLTETKDVKDAAALNQNIRALADSIRKTNGDIRVLQSSATADYARLVGTQTLSGINTFTSTATFNGPVTLNRSSFTFIPEITVSGTGNFATCTATVTMTLPVASDVEIVVSGSLFGDSLGFSYCWNVLLDGAFTQFGANNWMHCAYEPSASVYAPASGVVRLVGVSAGAHNFCIAPGAGAAGPNTRFSYNTVRSRFGVREAK